MTDLALMVFDVVAIATLVFAIYFPRHRRRDMVVAFLGVNVGVLAVAEALLASTITAGLGLGLFGVLSIIRLRSDELQQHEVAYYFAALALGLIGGLTTTVTWVSPALMALIVVALYIGDHPLLFGAYRSQTITLDVACLDETEARARLEELVEGTVHRVSIRKVDLVRDTTTVDVRYRLESSHRGEAVAIPTGISRS